jgi:hypothetical protein
MSDQIHKVSEQVGLMTQFEFCEFSCSDSSHERHQHLNQFHFLISSELSFSLRILSETRIACTVEA